MASYKPQGLGLQEPGAGRQSTPKPGSRYAKVINPNQNSGNLDSVIGQGPDASYIQFTKQRAADLAVKIQQQKTRQQQQKVQQQQQAKQNAAQKSKAPNLAQKIVGYIKNVPSAATTSEQTVAKVGARLLPGGQNDIKAENASIDSANKNRQFINSQVQAGKIKPELASKLLKSQEQTLNQNDQAIKSTAASIPTRGQAEAGVIGTAGDILTAGALPEVKLASKLAAKMANIGITGGAYAADSALNAAAGGGTKKQIEENAVAGTLLPGALHVTGKAVGKGIETAKVASGKDEGVNNLITRSQMNQAKGRMSLGKQAVAGAEEPGAPPKVNAVANPDLVKQGLIKPAINHIQATSLKMGADTLGTKLDKATVDKYAADIKAGKPIEPVVVTHEKGGTYVQDGKHRLEAMKRAGVEDIPTVDRATAVKPTEAKQLTPTATASMPEVSGYTHSSHLVKDYADMLHGMESHAKGGQMIPNGEGGYIRTSEHGQFYRDYYKEHKSAPPASAYVAEAEKQLSTGKGAYGASDDYQILKDRETPKVANEQTQSPDKQQTTEELPKNEPVPAAEKPPNPMSEAGGITPGAPIADLKEFMDTTKKNTKISSSVADELHGLNGAGTADRVALTKFLKTTEHIKAADLEGAYHYAEDKTSPATAEQKAIFEKYVKPLQDETQAARGRLGKQGVIIGSDHMHRIARGKGGALEQFIKGERPNPVGGGKLRKTTDSMKTRTMKIIADENGNRTVVAIKTPKDKLGMAKGNKRVTAFVNGKPQDMGSFNLKSNEDRMQKELKPAQLKLANLEKEKQILSATKSRTMASSQRLSNIESQLVEANRNVANVLNKYDLNELNGKTFKAKNGKTYTIGEATTKEVEANTKIRYYKNPIVNSAIDYLQTRSAERANQFLNTWKTSEGFKDVAVKSGEGEVPHGWITTKAPQFMGYHFTPKVAHVLDDFAGMAHEDPLRALSGMNRFLRTTIFFNPLIHIPNVVMHWLPNRGASNWINPVGYVRLGKTGIRAINDVIHQNKEYTDMLRSGAPMLSFNQEHFTEQIGKMMDASLADETTARKVAGALGYTNPATLVKAWYNFSHKVTWVSNDILTLQAILEEQAKGKTLEEAIKNTSKHIPDYRIPSEIMGNRAIKQILSNPNLTMFSSYHYGVLKNYATMVRDLVGKNASIKDRAGSIDKMMMAGVTALVLYPLLDQVAQKISGNSNAKLKRAGAFALPDAIAQVAQGRKTPGQVASGVVTPAPGTRGGLQLLQNKDAFGNQIYNPGDIVHPSQLAKDIGDFSSSLISPVSQGKRLTSGKANIKDFVAGLFSIQNPKTDLQVQLNNTVKQQFGDTGITKAQQKVIQAKAAARDQIAKGHGDSKAKALVDQGLLSASTLKKFEASAKWTPEQRSFDSLTVQNKLKILQQASPQDRASLIGDMKGLQKQLGKMAKSKRSTPANRAAAQDTLKLLGGDSNTANYSYDNGARTSNESVLKSVAAYASAFKTSPATAFNRIFTGQRITRTNNGAVIVQRMSVGSSQGIKGQLGGKNKTMKLDHTVPLELGGSNDQSNLKLVTAQTWASYTPVEDYLGKQLQKNKINAKQAQQKIIAFKTGKLKASDIIGH